MRRGQGADGILHSLQCSCKLYSVRLQYFYGKPSATKSPYHKTCHTNAHSSNKCNVWFRGGGGGIPPLASMSMRTDVQTVVRQLYTLIYHIYTVVGQLVLEFWRTSEGHGAKLAVKSKSSPSLWSSVSQPTATESARDAPKGGRSWYKYDTYLHTIRQYTPACMHT